MPINSDDRDYQKSQLYNKTDAISSQRVKNITSRKVNKE